MTRSQTMAVALVAMLTPLLAESTASAQTFGGASWRNMYNPFACWGSTLPSYPAATGCQPGASQSRYCETPDQVKDYFRRKLANIEYRYKIKPALVRARLERDRQLGEVKNEYAGTIERNSQRVEELARRYAPARLTAFEFNPITGAISWPALFEEYDQFAADRARVEALFAQRTPYHSGATSRNCVEIRKATGRMKATLRGMQVELGGTAYAAAKSFLSSLAYEAQFPVESAMAQVAAK